LGNAGECPWPLTSSRLSPARVTASTFYRNSGQPLSQVITIPAAKAHLKLTYKDAERASCSRMRTTIVVYDSMPEVRECRDIMQRVFKDYDCLQTLKREPPSSWFLFTFPGDSLASTEPIGCTALAESYFRRAIALGDQLEEEKQMPPAENAIARLGKTQHRSRTRSSASLIS